MSLNFPNSPAQSDVFTDQNGGKWRYNGKSWVKIESEVGINSLDDVDATNFADNKIMQFRNNIFQENNSDKVPDLNSDLLDSKEGAYYLDWNNFQNKPNSLSGYGITDAQNIESLDDIQDVDLTIKTPLTNDTLYYNGYKWVPGVVSEITSVKDNRVYLTTDNGSGVPSVIMNYTPLTDEYVKIRLDKTYSVNTDTIIINGFEKPLYYNGKQVSGDVLKFGSIFDILIFDISSQNSVFEIIGGVDSSVVEIIFDGTKIVRKNEFKTNNNNIYEVLLDTSVNITQNVLDLGGLSGNIKFNGYSVPVSVLNSLNGFRIKWDTNGYWNIVNDQLTVVNDVTVYIGNNQTDSDFIYLYEIFNWMDKVVVPDIINFTIIIKAGTYTYTSPVNISNKQSGNISFFGEGLDGTGNPDTILIFDDNSSITISDSIIYSLGRFKIKSQTAPYTGVLNGLSVYRSTIKQTEGKIIIDGFYHGLAIVDKSTIYVSETLLITNTVRDGVHMSKYSKMEVIDDKLRVTNAGNDGVIVAIFSYLQAKNAQILESSHIGLNISLSSGAIVQGILVRGAAFYGVFVTTLSSVDLTNATVWNTQSYPIYSYNNSFISCFNTGVSNTPAGVAAYRAFYMSNIYTGSGNPGVKTFSPAKNTVGNANSYIVG